MFATTDHARVLLRRADALLEDAAGADDDAERFLTAYLAALRGAGAALALVEPAPKRGRSRNAWVRLASASPDLADWSGYFSGYSPIRSAVEAGASARLSPSEVDEFFRQVGRFLHAVDDRSVTSRMSDSIPA